MNVNKYIMCLSLASAALAFTSCNDFLDKYPDSRMDLKTPSESSQLLVSAYPQGHPAYLLEMYSDNTDEQLHSTWSAFDRFQEQAYQWKDIDEVSNPETPHQLWEAHYAAISTCNETLDHIDKAKDKEAYDAQKGEALLCRAFAMFQLSTVFCQAYDKTTAQNNLGLPYPKQPERVVGRLMERGTLAELYKNIENDLVEGMKLVGTKYDKPKFHFTKQAAYAFATRFYLYAQQYDKAVEYANKVLGDHPEDILRNWAEWNRLGPSGLTTSRLMTSHVPIMSVVTGRQYLRSKPTHRVSSHLIQWRIQQRILPSCTLSTLQVHLRNGIKSCRLQVQRVRVSSIES